jgi:hypothetical protein
MTSAATHVLQLVRKNVATANVSNIKYFCLYDCVLIINFLQKKGELIMGIIKKYENWKNFVQKEAIKNAIKTIKKNMAEYALDIIRTAEKEKTNIICCFFIDKDGEIYMPKDNIATPLLDSAEWYKFNAYGEDMICFCKIRIIYDNSEQRVVDVNCYKTIDDMPLNRYIDEIEYKILALIDLDKWKMKSEKKLKATPDQISILKDLCSDTGVKNLADFIIFAAENNVKTDGFEDLSFSDAGKLISRCLLRF